MWSINSLFIFCYLPATIPSHNPRSHAFLNSMALHNCRDKNMLWIFRNLACVCMSQKCHALRFFCFLFFQFFQCEMCLFACMNIHICVCVSLPWIQVTEPTKEGTKQFYIIISKDQYRSVTKYVLIQRRCWCSFRLAKNSLLCKFFILLFFHKLTSIDYWKLEITPFPIWPASEVE